jgi:hypothetical protein
MFWSVDETLYNVDQLVENAQATINRAIQRNMPSKDIQLLQEAFHHMLVTLPLLLSLIRSIAVSQLAAADQVWRLIQTHEDIPYRVYQMPPRILNAWSRSPGLEHTVDSVIPSLVHADRLLKLLSLVIARPLISEDLLVQKGTEVARMDLELRKAFEESYQKNKNKPSRKYSQGSSKAGAATSSEAAEVHAGFMVETAAKKAAAPDTLKEMRKELDQSLARLERDEDDDSSVEGGTVTGSSETRVTNALDSVPSVLVQSSVLANVVVGSSASSKLNYIINEVRTYSI